MIDQSGHFSHQVRASSHHHAAFTTNSEIFRWKERETRHVPYRSRHHAVGRYRAVSLCSVFDVRYPVVMAPRHEALVAHLSEQMDGNDRFCFGCASRFKRLKVNAPVVTLNVNKHRRGSHQIYTSGGRNVSQRGDKHLIAWADVQQVECPPKSNGTALTGCAGQGPAHRSKFFTKRSAFWALHPVAGVKYSDRCGTHFIVP